VTPPVPAISIDASMRVNHKIPLPHTNGGSLIGEMSTTAAAGPNPVTAAARDGVPSGPSEEILGGVSPEIQVGDSKPPQTAFACESRPSTDRSSDADYGRILCRPRGGIPGSEPGLVMHVLVSLVVTLHVVFIENRSMSFGPRPSFATITSLGEIGV
jgi:hypothetical protein